MQRINVAAVRPGLMIAMVGTAADPIDPGTVALWRDYLRRWTAGNHVRAAASLLASAILAWTLTQD